METLTTESVQLSEPAAGPTPRAAAKRIVRACTVRKPAAELYAFWRQLDNLPQLAKVPLEISRDASGTTHWVARAPRGRQHLEWNLILTEEIPGERLNWRSPPGSSPVHRGSIQFGAAPGDEGTEVTMAVELDPHERVGNAWASPTGGLASWVTKLKGEGLKYHITEGLRRFKALMEAGEMPTTTGQPAGNRRRAS
jgi:uncharacterized membrane protein